MNAKLRLVEQELVACEEEMSYLTRGGKKFLCGEPVLSVTDEIVKAIEDCCLKNKMTCTVSVTSHSVTLGMSQWVLVYENITHRFRRTINLKYYVNVGKYEIGGHRPMYPTIHEVADAIVMHGAE